MKYSAHVVLLGRPVMTKSFKYLTALTLIACGCLYTLTTHASVCFIPENNCNGTSISGFDIDTEELASKCAALGYTTKKEECVNPSHNGGVCPYDNSWVICCEPKFNYSAPCVHPLTQVAKCGNRYQCACADNFKYYMASISSGSVCTNYKTNGQYPHAYTDGNYCALITSDNQGHEAGLTIYERCVCDATLYPKTDDICKQEDPNTECGGDTCVGSETGTQCSICKCQAKFTKKRNSCSFGIKRGSPICTQGGIDYVEANACCDCPSGSFPYTSASDHTAVKEYEACSIANHCEGNSSERYRAKTCQDGYKLDTTGTKCIQQGCFDSIQEYLETGKSPDWELLVPGTRPTKNKVVIADDPGYGTVKWEHLYNKKVYSGPYFASTISGSDMFTKAVKNTCKTVPTIKISSTDTTSTGQIDLTSVMLETSYWINRGGFKCTNCTLYMSSSYINEADTDLEYDSNNSVNADNMEVDAYGINIAKSGADFHAHGYDFLIGGGSFEVINFPNLGNRVDYDASTLGITSNFVPNNSVIIRGDPDRRIKFEIPGASTPSLGNLKINGGMMFNYADVFVKYAYIGPKSPNRDSTTCGTYYGYSCHNCGCYVRSFVNTYNTNWYLRDSSYDTYNVYFAPGSYLGVPAGSNSVSFDHQGG